MYFKCFKKIGAAVLAAPLVFGTQTAAPVLAAEDNIEIVLTDVTEDEQTMLGEAKVMVSVKGNVSEASTVQIAFSFNGELPLNDSVDFFIGADNVENGNWRDMSGSAVGKTSGTFTVSVIDITNG